MININAQCSLQARDATLDVEVANILGLVQDLKQLRDRWDGMLAESKLVAELRAAVLIHR